MPKRIVWHYCYSNNIEAILRSLVLLPPIKTPQFDWSLPAHMTKAGLADSKMLLFSQREDWEPASYRALSTAIGMIRLEKLEDYEAHGFTVYRIGVSTKWLRPYSVLRRLTGHPQWLHDGQEKVNREIGANSFDWWGTTKPVTAGDWEDVQVWRPDLQTWESIMTKTPIEDSEVAQEERANA